MDKLPMNDVPMLVSAINFLLRDHEFDTLDEICYHFHVNRADLKLKWQPRVSNGQKNRRSSGKSASIRILMQEKLR